MKCKTHREIMVKFRAAPEEYALIQRKAELSGIVSLSAYLRKMAIDGYVIKLELPELREMLSLLRRSAIISIRLPNASTRPAESTPRIWKYAKTAAGALAVR